MTITILDQKAFKTLEVHNMIIQAMGLFLAKFAKQYNFRNISAG